MKISDLEQAGGFVSEAGEKRTIKWGGHDGEVFVRRVSFGKIAATQSMPDAERNMALVRECIRLGDNGDEQLSAAQVEALAPTLAGAFLAAIAEVNALSEEPDAKN